MTRMILAGVLRGIVMFMAGAFEHMVLQWADRAFKDLQLNRRRMFNL